MEQKHAGDGLQNVTFFIGKFSVFLSLKICFDGSHQKLVKNVQKQIHVCGLSLEMNVSVLLALFLAFPPQNHNKHTNPTVQKYPSNKGCILYPVCLYLQRIPVIKYQVLHNFTPSVKYLLPDFIFMVHACTVYSLFQPFFLLINCQRIVSQSTLEIDEQFTK